MFRTCSILVVFGVVCFVGVLSADAATFNARQDFSPTDNPTGKGWSYGYTYSLDGSMTVYPSHYIDYNGYYGWHDTSGIVIPHVTLFDKPLPWGFVAAPDELGLHPGYGGQFSIIRWTAPSDGTATVVNRFRDAGTGLLEVFTYHNAAKLTDDVLVDYDTTPTYNNTFSVLAGDKIDFAVGYMGSADGDTTVVAASV
jgi:hypothetical protein